MRPEELTIINHWVDRYTVGTWGIYVNGIRVRVRSGKSAWGTPAKAKTAFINLVKYSSLAHQIINMRTGPGPRTTEQIKVVINELMESGRVQIMRDIPHNTNVPSN